MRRRKILLTLTAVLVGIVGLQRPAAASCVGPTPSFEEGEYQRGEPVPVAGEWFGDNCYDTGLSPEGEDVLGRPITDIEVWFLQGDIGWLVARGDAGFDYAWWTSPPVPNDASPGTLTVELRYGTNEWPLGTITVLDGAPIGTQLTEPLPFDTNVDMSGDDLPPIEEPAAEPPAEEAPTDEAPVEAPDAEEAVSPEGAEELADADDDSSDRGRNLALGVAAVGIAVAALVGLSRRSA
ncbi:MAG: hypothetical protein AAF548_07725 [Actinomycetota bacterium]